MKIVGTITSSSTYLFAITCGTALGARLDVYSLYSSVTGYELQASQLNSKAVAAFNDHLLCSAHIARTGYVSKYAGNLGVASTVIAMMKDTGHLADIVAGDIALGEHIYAGCTINIEYQNSAISSVAQIKGLTYTKVSAGPVTRDIVVGQARHRVKTYEEIIAGRDMSWYIDSNGHCKKDYRLIQSIEELREVMKDAADCTFMSFDTETTGTDFFWYGGDESRRSKICGMSISWRKDQGIYVPFMSALFNTLDLAEAMSILYPIMRSKKLVAHNGMFDFKVFYSYGYYLPVTHDTLLMAFNINPEVKNGSKGLKTLTRKYMHHETIELDEITGTPIIPELIPYIDAELIKVYACSDSDYTLQLCHILLPEVEHMQSYFLDTKLIDILAIAEYQGAPINMQLLQTMSQINRRDMQRVEKLMEKYLRLAGAQVLAARAIKETAGVGHTPTEEEIKELCHYQPFLKSIEGAFCKQPPSKDAGKPLQFSSSADIAYILYDLLGYPVTKTSDAGTRTADKEALTRLLEYTSTTTSEFLKCDVVTSAKEFGVDSDNVVVSKSKFEGYKYPFAYLLTVWRKLQKFDSSFFAPLLEESGTGYYCTTNSMTSAETGRVINSVQTLEGSLKELVIPRNDDWYLIVFDKSQIEYRVMLGLASTYWNALIKSGYLAGNALNIAKSRNLNALIESLNNWEKDYHREGGAIFAGCTPDTMTNKQRKRVKAIHFSVPYGAEAASVAKPKLAGHPESEWGEIIAETEGELAAWRDKLYPLYYFLEHVRDVALTPISKNPLGVYGVNGMVKNALGRYRLFDLSDTSFKQQASIRRKAGNYPIQSFARDIFFSGVYRLFNRLKREGIITERFEDCKAVLNLFIHDEVVLQVHKSIHPYRMYKYIMETNLTKLTGHPTYFMGIAVADTWGKGKTDMYEAPIAYVDECIAKYDANRAYYDNIASTVPSLAELDYTALALDGITHWFARRACQELSKVLNGQTVIDPVFICDNLLNYYVKPRLPFYTKPCRKQEYLFDPSLPVDTADKKYNGFIKLFDYYLLITGEYKKYKLLFNGTEIPYEDVLILDIDNVKPSEDTDDLASLADIDFDAFSLLSEMDEDSREQEEKDAEEVYLLEDPGLVDLSTPVVTTVHAEEEKASVPAMWAEDADGDIIFFVTDMSNGQFQKLTTFLKGYISPAGKPLYFFNTHKVYSGVKIGITFTAEQVFAAVYRGEKTSFFGG